MDPTELVAAGLVLVAAVVAGTVVHELAHALALEAFDVPYAVEWLPDDAGAASAGVYGAWASVTPRAIPADLAPWRLKVAALAPLALGAPLALVPAGVLPDPFGTGSVLLQAATIGWLACALPSPQDFSLFAHAEDAVAEYATGDAE